MESEPLSSIAIAGAWGYIGQKFLGAARSLRLETRAYDPGPVPVDVDQGCITRIASESEFYRQEVDLFHLALHPEHRQKGLGILLDRGRDEPIAVLCEKPMATPDCPDRCQQIISSSSRSGAVLLYDFPELFDPMTRRIREYLGRFRQVTIDSIGLQRSKDREDPANQRNYKRMVPIQYQESVHSLAFVLYLLGSLKQSLEAVFIEGLSVRARSQPYDPPNRTDYPHVVDGRCDYALTFGETEVTGRTDFKRGAPWSKRRTIRGVGDDQPFVIDLDFLEGEKRLSINGESEDDVVDTNSYAEVIKTFGRWRHEIDRQELMTGIYPNPSFAHVSYQLSSLLWRASRQKETISLASLDALLNFDARYSK